MKFVTVKNGFEVANFVNVTKATNLTFGLLLTICGTVSLAQTNTTFKPNTPMEKTLLSCLVDAEGGPNVYVTLTKDTSVDYLTIYLFDDTGKSTYFFQTGKDKVAAAVDAGTINFPMMSEKTKNENGVLKNTGFFILSPAAAANKPLELLILANGNLYPFACAKGSQLPVLNKP